MSNFVQKSNQALIDKYTYDVIGNRIQSVHNGFAQQCTYPTTSNRLLSGGGLVRSDDESGNTTSIGGDQLSFSYDPQGRMTEAKRNGQLVMSYRTNGKGEQVQRFIGKSSTYSLFDQQGHWLGDYDEAGKPKQQAIWLGDIPVAVVGSNSPVGTAASSDQKLAYIEADHLNTPRVVIDPERNVAIWSWDIQAEPFGDSQPNQDPDKDGKQFTLDLRYPGQRYDSATSLYQNDRRDYDPKAGRYIQSDPIGLLGGINTYLYVEGIPIKFVDPSGLQAFEPGMTPLSTATSK